MASNDEGDLNIPPLAFTVAITGHRDIAIERQAALQSQIAQLLRVISTDLSDQAVQSALDRRRAIELRFLSAMADGADRVGAAAALEAGWPLHVILPFAPSDYKATLADQRADGFDEILSKAELRMILADWQWQQDLEAPADIHAAGLEDHWRALRYQTIGHILVRQCDLLIAVWRGDRAAGTGGTAEVIAEAHRTGVPVLWIDERSLAIHALYDAKLRSRDSSVLELANLARDGIGADSLAGAIRPAIAAVLFGSGSNAEPVDRYITREKNRPHSWSCFYQLIVWLTLLGRKCAWDPKQALRTWPGLRQKVHADWTDPFADGTDPAAIALSAVGQRFAWHGMRADAISTRLGHHYRSSYIGIFLLAASAVVMALIGLWPPLEANKPYFVAVELVCLGCTLAIWIVSHKLHVHQRWINARHLAESLRALRMLAWLGFAGRRPTGTHEPWTARFSNALAALPGLPDVTIDLPVLRKQAQALLGVVGDQIAYHRLNHARLSAFHHRLDMMGLSFIGLAALVSFVYLLLAHELPHEGDSYEKLSRLAAIAGGIGPAVAAAIAGIRYHGDFERFAHRSELSHVALERMAERLRTLLARSEACGERCKGTDRPLYEQLLDIGLDAQAVFEDDLEDWRFVYADRPMPLP